MMLLVQNVTLSSEDASLILASCEYSSIGCFSGMNQSGIIKSDTAGKAL
jgi:hypothetical protein